MFLLLILITILFSNCHLVSSKYTIPEESMIEKMPKTKNKNVILSTFQFFDNKEVDMGWVAPEIIHVLKMQNGFKEIINEKDINFSNTNSGILVKFTVFKSKWNKFDSGGPLGLFSSTTNYTREVIQYFDVYDINGKPFTKTVTDDENKNCIIFDISNLRKIYSGKATTSISGKKGSFAGDAFYKKLGKLIMRDLGNQVGNQLFYEIN